MRYKTSDHILYWLFPLLSASVFFVARAIGQETYDQWVMSPFGFTESFIGAVLLLTVLLGIYILKDPAIWKQPKIRWWLILYVLAVFYFMGEDQNWGQYYRARYFGYEVNTFWLDHNNEQETNLHNMSTWFNEKPRILVMLWVLVAGLLVPLGWKFPKEKTKKFVPEVFWPDRRLLPLAIAALTIRLPEKLKLIMPELNVKAVRLSEVQELFFAFFMLLFLLQIYQRVKTK